MIARMIIDTMARYEKSCGAPPLRMRGSRHLNMLLQREMEEDGVKFVFDPDYCKKHALGQDEFQFRGVVVKCDLPTVTPTVLAVFDYKLEEF